MTKILARALHRRALAYVALKEEAKAERDLVEVTKLADDKKYSLELEKVRAIIKDNKEREEAKFRKMFN